MAHQRRRIMGYTDLGAVQQPPLPPGIALTARDDGLAYFLSHNSGAETLLLVTPVPTWWKGIVLGARAGPVVVTGDNKVARLYVTGAALTHEEAPAHAAGTRHPPVWTRSGTERVVFEVTIPTLGGAFTLVRTNL